MGQRSVIFHAFLASLVPIAHAVGVAPSGLSSRDFYRSRRFRTTNSTPLGASIHDSASAESAVAVLDDLSRKSRVLLAQKRSGNKGEHHLLTWNAGGGAPQPEFLGGPWETDFGGMYSKVEQMTGVLLFEIAKCEVDFVKEPKDGGTDFRKYEQRYKGMYDKFQDLKKTAAFEDFDKKLTGLTFTTLLSGLTSPVKGEEKKTIPEWVGECTMEVAIADTLKLCPKKRDVKQKCGFDLKSEGCWKERGALPVYGESFFELHDARTTGEDEYWKLFMEGLEKQTKKEGKGCSPAKDDKFPKDGNPGAHIKSRKGGTVTYTKTEKDKEDTTVTDEPTPEIFTFEQWSKTAAWDTLVIELTTISIDILNAMEPSGTPLTLKKKDGEGYKFVHYIDDTQAKKTITNIVAGAKKSIKPDIIFLQEIKKVEADDVDYDVTVFKEDTAIYVNKEFGGIDTKASAALQKAWDMMMGHISTRFAHEIVEEVAIKLEKEEKDYEYLKKSEDVNDQEKLADEMKAAGARIHLNGIPERQLPTKDDGPTDGMAKRVANQRSEMLKAAAEKGVVYANKLQLVTVAMTAKKPSVLLFSIHSDSDGYFCAQYLNLAKKFYDTIHDHNDYEITRMYIGMDANVLPPNGHNSWDPKKGFTYTQLEQALPSGMKMLDPGTKTVKKVRTFLQTQFSKIGKDDEEKKDLLFVYPADVVGSTTSNVYNRYAEGTGFSLIDPKEGEPPVYYPTNAWPVDHFMSFATVSEKPQSMGTTVCNALQKTVRETKHKLLTIFTNRKKSLATKSADLAAAALDELKKSTGLLAQIEAAAADAKLKLNKTAAAATKFGEKTLEKTGEALEKGEKLLGDTTKSAVTSVEEGAKETGKVLADSVEETGKTLMTALEKGAENTTKVVKKTVDEIKKKMRRFMRAASK